MSAACSNKRPNVLFVLSDQQRWDTVNCYGQPMILGLTPNLDQMASDGVLFRHAFTCQPVCGPARACLQSGQYATETGCFTNSRALPVGQITIAGLLNDAGYETAYIGKWHLASNHLATDNDADHFLTRPVPRDRRGGYRDHWLAAEGLEFTSSGYEGYLYDGGERRVDFEGYRPDALTNFALDYLRDVATRKSGKPFLLFLSYIEPHQQNDLNRYVGPIGSKARFANYEPPGDLVGTEGDWRLHLPDYLGCCWSLDRNLGRLRAELDVLGLTDDTIVIYTSDHGCHFRTRNDEYKRSPHEASIRVPLIVSGPGFRGGREVDELVSLIDLPPTVLAAAGVAAPISMRGQPVQPLVDGSATGWPEEVFVQVSEDHIGRAIRTRQWKYSIWVPRDAAYGSALRLSASDRYTEQFLYDLHADPHERNNLVAERELASVRADLAAKLKRRMVAIGEEEPEIVPASVRVD